MRYIQFKNFPYAGGIMTLKTQCCILPESHCKPRRYFCQRECAALRPSCSLYHCQFFHTFSVTKGPPHFTVLQWSIFVSVKQNCCTRNFTNLAIWAQPRARVKVVWLQSAEVNFCTSLHSFHILKYT